MRMTLSSQLRGLKGRSQATSECTTGMKVGRKYLRNGWSATAVPILGAEISLNRAVSEPTDDGMVLGL